MAKIGLALAGAAIGAFFGPIGAEIGFTLGGILGSMLFPGKPVFGPRLNDLQVSSATNGAPIPFGYGTDRVAGNMIWTNGITEHNVTTGGGIGGKGGQPQQTTYNYTGSFAVAFGEGPAKVGRIWFDTKIAYDPNDNYVGIKLIDPLGFGYPSAPLLIVTDTAFPVTAGTQVTLTGTIISNDTGGGTTLDQVTSVEAVIAPNEFIIKNQGFSNLNGDGAITASGTIGITAAGGQAITKLSMVGDLATAICGLNPEPGTQVLIIDIPAALHGNAYAGYFTVVSSTSTFFTYYNPPNTLFTIGDNTGTIFCGWAVPAQPQYPPPTIYTGTELQGPDPTIQATEGAANTPAFRPLIYAVWNNLPLANFSNRLPNVRAEITYLLAPLTKLGMGTLQQQQLTRQLGGTEAGFSFTPYNPGNFCIVGVSQQQGLSNKWVKIATSNWAIAIASLSSVDEVFEDLGPAGGFPQDQNLLCFAGSGGQLILPVTSATVTNNVLTCLVGAFCSYIVGQQIKLSGFAFSGSFLSGQTVTVASVAADGSSFTANFTHANSSPDSGTATCLGYLQFTAKTFPSPPTTMTFNNPVTPGSVLVLMNIDGDNNATGDITTLTDNQGDNWIRFRDTNVGDPVSAAYVQSAVGGVTTITINGNLNGVYLYEFPALPSPAASNNLQAIVVDVSKRAGLSVSEIDVSALSTITVPSALGYVIGRPTTAQDCLRPLAQAFFFDGCESGGTIRFVPRGAAAQALTVPETDLGLVKDNFKIQEQVAQIQGLPLEVKLLFKDPALNYQQNYTLKRRAARIVITKNQDVIELPLVIDSTTARQIVERMLYIQYLERKPYIFNLWKALYMLYDPTDVVNFTYESNLYSARFVKTAIGVDYKIEVQSVEENPPIPAQVLAGMTVPATSPYTSTATGTSGTGPTVAPQHVVTVPNTVLFLEDIPLLRDSDSNPAGSGYYAAFSTSDLADWTGATLQESSDNSTFVQVDKDSVACSYGITLGQLLAPASPWDWDYSNSVVIRMLAGTLAGSSQFNVLNGANAMLIGKEIIQFENAVQNPDGSYTISTLLRGRRGTEIYSGLHTTGETAILLPAGGITREQVSLANIQVLRYFKGVTYGQDPTQVASQQFINSGKDLMPYAPAQLSGTRDSSKNLTLQWLRRTRIGGDWLNGIGEVPLSEAFESYDVEIINVSSVVRTFSDVPLPVVIYTAAMQVADFGSTQSKVTFNVYQKSSAIGRGFVSTATV